MKKILMTLTLAFAAMIAIPSVANAQDAKQEQKKECCKEKKECKKEESKACCKEDKACCKEDKACCKEGKAGKDGKKMNRAHSGKKMRAEGKRTAEPKDSKMRRANKENPVFNDINLSEEQKIKIKDLREKSVAAEKKSKAEMKAKSKEEKQKLRADFDKEMEKILDKDQLKQYQANKAEMEAIRAAKQSKLPKTEKKDK